MDCYRIEVDAPPLPGVPASAMRSTMSSLSECSKAGRKLNARCNPSISLAWPRQRFVVLLDSLNNRARAPQPYVQHCWRTGCGHKFGTTDRLSPSRG
eukprot:352226-Chlamydomonas_euryale.AAC.2